MKKSLAILIILLILLHIVNCGIFFFHGWCFRCIHGNIVIEPSFTARDTTTFAEMKVTIRKGSKDYNTHYDYHAKLKSDGSYKTEKSTFREQNDCDNDCGSKSLPGSLKVIISKAKSDQIIFDTVFYCSNFGFRMMI